MNNSKAFLYCSDLAKTFLEGKVKVEVLKSVQLEIHEGDRIAIQGASGSGKSTLLHILGGLDVPTKGMVWLKDLAFSAALDKKRTLMRNQYLGFVYQFHHLLAEFSVLENVCMPLLIRGVTWKQAKKEAIPLLQKVGLEHRLEHKPPELSGGEKQRAAVARAVIGKPMAVLADEPTGNLDQESASQVYGMLLELNKTLNSSLVIVTHDLQLAACMDKIFHLKAGYLERVK